MTNISYTQVGEVSLPNLTSSEPKPLGKYGRMRRTYLKEHRPILWNRLILSGKLNEHLAEIDSTASRRMEQLTSELSARNQLTEELKSANPLEWVRLANSIHAQAEELVLAELVLN